jgi:hypothetical protein
MGNLKVPFPMLMKRESYPSWAHGMEYALRALNLWSYIESPNVVQDPGYFQVMTILHQNVAPHMQVRVAMCKTPKEAWMEVKENCEGAAEHFEDMKRAELAHLKKLPSESIEFYISRALAIQESLARANIVMNDRQLLYHVMNGLPREYDSVRSSFALQKGITVNDAQSALTDLETRLKGNQGEIAFYGGVFRGRCHKCGERGHTKYQCKASEETVRKYRESSEKHSSSNSSAFAGFAKEIAQIIKDELAKPVEHPSLRGRPQTRDVIEMGF